MDALEYCPGQLNRGQLLILKQLMRLVDSQPVNYLPHPLTPPLLQRRGGDVYKRGFAPLKLP